MAEIVNLRRAKKRIERRAAAAKAEENRVRFGLTLQEKAKAGSERARLLSSLDGARLVRERDGDEPAGG